MTDYLKTLKYIGRSGAVVEFQYQGGRKRDAWLYRFSGSRLWWVGGRSKFDAMVRASQHVGRSMKDMNWFPCREAA